MRRVAPTLLGTFLLVVGLCHGQSLADAARENRKQKAKEANSSAKVVTEGDFSASPDVTIRLVPGAMSSGEGTLVAPGRGKHGYYITNLDASRFPNGGVLHITITLGSGASEASFDLYSQGARLPTEGFPNSLASAHNVRSGSVAKIDYRFNHATTFRLASEGSWNAKAGDTNTHSFVADVGNP
jgi:hypothetical protein